MIAFQDLLIEHQNRTGVIIAKYIGKYEDIKSPKTMKIWDSFLLENANDLITELGQSSIDVFHHALVSKINLEKDDLNALREVNLNATARYHTEFKRLYETIVFKESQKVPFVKLAVLTAATVLPVAYFWKDFFQKTLLTNILKIRDFIIKLGDWLSNFLNKLI